MKKRCLVFSFEPFGGEAVNAAAEASRHLPDEVEGIEIVRRQLPVSFARTVAAASEIVEAESPDVILALGQAAGRASVCLERVALNVVKSEKSDNDGQIADGRKIVADGPGACFTPLPVDALSAAMRADGEPVFVSNSAGTYVCNNLYYGLLHKFSNIPTLFIHLPLTPAQAAARTSSTPSMAPSLAAAILTRLIPRL